MTVGDLPERLDGGPICHDVSPFKGIEQWEIDAVATEALMDEAAARIRALEGENARLNERNAEVSMLAHRWMVAHDMRQAGKPVEYPEPADLPASIARAEAAEASLAKASAALKEVKVIAATAGAPGELTIPQAMARLIRICRDAGITAPYDELRETLASIRQEPKG